MVKVPQKCYVNITEPMFYKRCSERPDTPEYMYSIAGFDPCYPFDFSVPKLVKFIVNCRNSLDDVDLGEMNLYTENIGFQYRDVIEAPKKPEFSYLASNPRNQYKIVNQSPMTVRISIFNWKWLSEIFVVNVPLLTPEEQAGLAELNTTIDFS